MEQFYDLAETTFDSWLIPIQPRQKLQPRGTTKPHENLLTPDASKKVTKEIYQCLLRIIPEECTDLCAILGAYGFDQDGYSALFGIMKCSCPYLQDFRPLWGLPWLETQTGYEY